MAVISAQCTLAFLVAFTVVALQWITGVYPRTYPFLFRCWEFYAYCTVFGAISVLVFLGADTIIGPEALAAVGSPGSAGTPLAGLANAAQTAGSAVSESVRLKPSFLSNRWFMAAALGLATKSLLKINLFSLPIQGKSVPFGIETVTLLFEPWLHESIRLGHFRAESSVLDPIAKKYVNTNPGTFKAAVKANVPSYLSAAEKKVVTTDIEGSSNIRECLSKYLAAFGRPELNRIVDLIPP